MIKNYIKALFIIIVLFSFLFSYSEDLKQKSDLNVYQDPGFWKKQALTEIIPFWEKTADWDNGGFFTDVGRDGSIGSEKGKYPRMLSRAVFGFSAAYLLSGDDKYLKLARHGLEYLTNYGWDRVNGGWYEYINSDKTPKISSKNLFDETYGNLGPVIYYFTTHDKNALQFVEKTHALMQTKAWDSEKGGYYAKVGSDWSVITTEKSFNAEIDTCSAYLIYYYLVKKDPAILKDLKQIADIVIARMVDPEAGYVGEYYDGNWNSTDPWLWVGHNLKTSWVLMRTYWLTGEKKYSDAALLIASYQIKNNWDKENYGWFFQFQGKNPGFRKTVKDWWTQEEGNVLMLNLFRFTGKPEYLEYFRECSYFWDTYQVDHRYGEVYPTVSQTGGIIDEYKGNLYKSAYHTMEQALFNYLYTSLYVNKSTAELYFKLDSDAGEKHYVKILEDPGVVIKSAKIDGKPWTNFNASGGYVTLPQGEGIKLKVVLGVNP